MRRPVLKIAVVLASLAVLATVASYLLLLTALPGRWILDAAHMKAYTGWAPILRTTWRTYTVSRSAR